MKRNLARSFIIMAALAPLGFNCHSRTDQSPAASLSVKADDSDQTVVAMQSSTEDGAPKQDSKVRLSSTAVVTALKAQQLGMNVKLSSNRDVVVPKGTSLLALYDNDCRKKNGSPLRFEAEKLSSVRDTSLSAMVTQANQDPCLVRIDENRYAIWATPITTQAASNDARVSEAKQISFSKALQAWDWFFSGTGIKNDVIVAVVDTGTLYTHPDLVDNVYTNANGKHGFDFVNNDDDPIDDFGHGTHVSGIIGARANNGIGITGIMGLHVKIMAVKVLDNKGGGLEADIVNGIRYAADQGAHVINLSVGGNFSSPSIRDALVYATGKGAVVVTAAGNSGVLMDASTNFFTPSGYAKDIPGAVAVGSVDAVTGSASAFSNYSSTYVWIAGPGSNGILSTYLANGYITIEGTSMACPAVSGAAALLVGAFRSHAVPYAPVDVINLLTESARPVPALSGLFRGGATLDVERAAKLFYSRHVMSGNGGTE